MLHRPKWKGEEDVKDGVNRQMFDKRILLPESFVIVEAYLKGQEDVKLAIDGTSYRYSLHP